MVIHNPKVGSSILAPLPIKSAIYDRRQSARIFTCDGIVTGAVKRLLDKDFYGEALLNRADRFDGERNVFLPYAGGHGFAGLRYRSAHFRI
jgi:hypothetical protein